MEKWRNIRNNEEEPRPLALRRYPTYHLTLTEWYAYRTRTHAQMLVRAVLVALFALTASTGAAGAAGAAPERVHEHRVRAAMAGKDLAAFALPDAFDSFGHFEFIETLEGGRGAMALGSGTEEDAGSDTSGSGSEGGAKTAAATGASSKPIPKKLKCSCSFAKLDAPAPSLFLEAMEKPRRAARHAMLRSTQ